MDDLGRLKVQAAFLVAELRATVGVNNMYCRNPFKKDCEKAIIRAAEMIEMLCDRLEENNA